MPLTYQNVQLDTSYGDREGKLVFEDGRLVAVISRLDAFHGEYAGYWYIEMVFPDWDGPLDACPNLEILEQRLIHGMSARTGD